ncbi:MAG: pyrimidine reductase family protein [Actinomycetes bacterium]
MRRLYPEFSADVDLAVAYAHEPGVVRANMVASADGAATFDSRSGGLSSSDDRKVFLALRKFCDVIIVGASTVRVEGYGPARGEGAPPIAVVSGSLDLDPTSRFFAEAVARPIIVTTEDADPERVGELSGVADIVAAGRGRVDIAVALDHLAHRGLTKVLSEGGPALLAGLVAADRLGELCLTAAPLLTLGHSKRITDAPPLDDASRLDLLHVLVDDEDSLFLRYAVRRRTTTADDR